MIKKILYLDIIADFICPWCFLGLKRLQQARRLVGDTGLDTQFRPFLLEADLPAGSRPYRLYLYRKYGGKDKAEATERELKEAGKAEEIDFDFDAIEIVPDTLDAHRIVYCAGQAEKGVQERLAGEIFSRYFEQGHNISRHDILAEAAGKAGMRADVVAKLLKTNIDRQIIRTEAAWPQQIGVNRVPCFILDKKFIIMGTQSAEALADIIQQAAEGFEPAGVQDR